MCSGVWPGVCSTVADDVAERQDIAVAHAFERERDIRLRREHVLGSRRFGERAAGGEVIGMDMRVDDEVDAHAGIASAARR